mmetsp:Transcript_25627/g.40960  ORF Transcript_25627/g.40960 Transcript_25627/m.40960 type:complete len:206 (+) Transcript_25627:331-948(+)
MCFTATLWLPSTRSISPSAASRSPMRPLRSAFMNGGIPARPSCTAHSASPFSNAALASVFSPLARCASESTRMANPWIVGGATTLLHSASVECIIFIAFSGSPSSSAVRAFSTERITSAGTCAGFSLDVVLASVAIAPELAQPPSGVGEERERPRNGRDRNFCSSCTYTRAAVSSTGDEAPRGDASCLTVCGGVVGVMGCGGWAR